MTSRPQHRAAALVSANGHGAVVYDCQAHRVAALWEHVYERWDEHAWSRNLLGATAVGVRTARGALWLDGVAPCARGYARESGVIWLRHELEDVCVETWFFAPWALRRPALVMVARVTLDHEGDASLFTLHDYRVGFTSNDDRIHPDGRNQRSAHLGEGFACLLSGVGGRVLHWPLEAPTRHGLDAACVRAALLEGRSLGNEPRGCRDGEQLVAFQKDFALDPGEPGWFGVVSAFERFADTSALAREVGSVYLGAHAQATLEAELDAWESWRVPTPAGLSNEERAIFRQSEAMLRQGQVWETTDASAGQLVASLPPGRWNTTWVRDHCYATVALALLGHLDEARAAADFLFTAEAGRFAPHVGHDYNVSVARYVGRGREESDFNEYGPNIELDGFGLTLWAYGTVVEASHDLAWARLRWSAAARLASALRRLRDERNGWIVADSSIWELHWNGQQRQHCYTTLAAIAGLRAFAAVADRLSEEAEAAYCREIANELSRTVLAYGRAPDGGLLGALGASPEAALDAAVVEAINWAVCAPNSDCARATLRRLEALRVAPDRGFRRRAVANPYDAAEWVFINLRIAAALRRAGEHAEAAKLLAAMTTLAQHCDGMLPELCSAETGLAAGESPMLGYGAGCYVIALLERSRG